MWRKRDDEVYIEGIKGRRGRGIGVKIDNNVEKKR